jgi:hypothetical protein
MAIPLLDQDHPESHWRHLLLESLKEEQDAWLWDQTIEELNLYLLKAESVMFTRTEAIYDSMMSQQSNDYMKNVELGLKIKNLEKTAAYEIIRLLSMNPDNLNSLI